MLGASTHPTSVLQSAEEIFDCLVRHGCTDLSSSIDPARFSSSPIETGGFGDVWKAWLRNGTPVAVKCLRLQKIMDGDEKGTKVYAFHIFALECGISKLNDASAWRASSIIGQRRGMKTFTICWV